MRRYLLNNYRSIGFTLIEMSFVIAIIGLLLVAAGTKMRDYAIESSGEKLGNEAATLMGAVNTYTAQYFEQIMNGTAIPGVANNLAPTVAELKVVGGLSASFPDTNSQNTGWIIKLNNRVPAGCVPPACDIESLVTTDAGIQDTDGTGVPNIKVLGAAMQTMEKNGVRAGISDENNPGTISGQGATWTAPNPVGSVAGVLAAKGGFGSSGYSQFVRMGDSRNVTLSGDLKVNGANGVTATHVKSDGNLQVAGTTTLTGAASIGNNLTVAGTSNLNGATSIGSNLAVAGTSNLHAANVTTINATGKIQTSGEIQASGKITGSTLYASNTITGGTSCGAGVVNGTISKAADGTIFSCRDGVWVDASQKPCVHGSFIRTTAGSWVVNIPLECKTFTVVKMIGGGGAGASAGKPGLNVNGDCHLASGGGGASGAVVSNVVMQNQSGVYNVTVGAGGTIPYVPNYRPPLCYWIQGNHGGASSISVSGVVLLSAAGGYRAGGDRSYDRNPPDLGWDGVSPGFAEWTGPGSNSGGWGVVNDNYAISRRGGAGGSSPFGPGSPGGGSTIGNVDAPPPPATSYGAGGGGGGYAYGGCAGWTCNYYYGNGSNGRNGYVEITW